MGLWLCPLTSWKPGAASHCVQAWYFMQSQGQESPQVRPAVPAHRVGLLGPGRPVHSLDRDITALPGACAEPWGCGRGSSCPHLSFPVPSARKDSSFLQTPKVSAVPATHVPLATHILSILWTISLQVCPGLPTRLQGS